MHQKETYTLQENQELAELVEKLAKHNITTKENNIFQ